jgi:uncharacterized protein (TIGR03067 family)
MQTSLILGLALVVSAPIPKDAPKKDAPSLFGEWVPESAVIGGKVDPPPPGTKVTITKEGRFVMKESKDEQVEMDFTFDAKKDPQEIDFAEPRGGMGQKAMKGIYKLEGDTLMICIAMGGDRPTAFTSPAGSMNMLITLKRAKKD